MFEWSSFVFCEKIWIPFTTRQEEELSHLTLTKTLNLFFKFVKYNLKILSCINELSACVVTGNWVSLARRYAPPPSIELQSKHVS